MGALQDFLDDVLHGEHDVLLVLSTLICWLAVGYVIWG